MRLHLAQRRRGGKLAGGCALQICSCHPQKWPGRCQVWQPQGLDPGRARPAALARPGGFGARSPRLLPEFRAALPSRGLSKLETPSWGGAEGHFSTVFSRAAVAGQGSYRWKHKQLHLNSWKPQTSRKEGK